MDEHMTDKDDRVYKEWADRYVEHYGQTLLEKQKMLDEQKIAYATPRADAQMQQLMRGHQASPEDQRSQEQQKRRRQSIAPLFAAAAALLVMFIGASVVLLQFSGQIFNSTTPSQSEPSASSPTDTNNTSADSTDAIRPLDFMLPVQFSVASVELDNGETIYHLNNSRYDNAVLTIRAPESNNNWMDGLDKVYIDGNPVSAKLRDEYKLLVFEEKNAIYTISCRDDMETLSTLYRSITG
jgi:hypothetical protein